MAFTVPQPPPKHMSPIGTKLLAPTPGRYSVSTPTLSPGAGELKVFTAGIPNKRTLSHPPLSPYSGGRRGVSEQLRGPRTIIS